MSATLVTGATGFLGKHLVRALLERGAGPLRLLARAAPRRPPRGVEVVEGSVLDPDAVARALDGAANVYHLAGRVSRRREDGPELFRLHVDGTRLLLERARAAGVARVVLASTSGTIGVSSEPDAIATEADAAPLELIKGWPYYLSKLYQEQAALQLAGETGLELVVVNPTLLLGPGDSRLSSTQDVLDFLRGKVPAIPEGGLSFVDVRDAAEATIAAMAAGRPGERYLLGAANWTFARFLRRLEQISGVRAPIVKVPRRIGDLAGRLLDGVARLTGKELLDPVTFEMARHTWYIDSGKARRELGFAPRDPDQTLVDTIKYLRKKFLDERADSPPDRHERGQV